MSRLVLLGASNVRRSLTTIAEIARENGVREIFGAFGHGRSYGARSCIPFRCLPGILESGIWSALRTEGRPAAALVTDVGNDILYGVPVPKILAWVGECLAHLAALGAAIRLTGLPMDRIRCVRGAEFLFFRSIFFPGSIVTREATIAAAGELDDGIRHLASGARAELVELPRGWYGADPIHIRRKERASAWADLLGVPGPRRPLPLGDAIRLRMAAPERRWLAGIDRTCRQPAISLRNGTQISLY